MNAIVPREHEKSSADVIGFSIAWTKSKKRCRFSPSGMDRGESRSCRSEMRTEGSSAGVFLWPADRPFTHSDLRQDNRGVSIVGFAPTFVVLASALRPIMRRTMITRRSEAKQVDSLHDSLSKSALTAAFILLRGAIHSASSAHVRPGVSLPPRVDPQRQDAGIAPRQGSARSARAQQIVPKE